MGSVLRRKRNIFTEEKLYECEWVLKIRPVKYLARLAA
jgi:hypothetical protein